MDLNNLEFFVPQTIEEAELLAKRIDLLDRVNKQNKDNLKKFLTDNPMQAISGLDKKYEYLDVPTWEFNSERVMEFMKYLALNGENPLQYISFPLKKLKTIEWLTDETLSSYATKKHSYRLSSKKL